MRYSKPHSSFVSTLFAKAKVILLIKLVALITLMLPAYLQANLQAKSDSVEFTQRYAGTLRDSLYDAEFSGAEGVAVGNFGLIVTTTDAGKDWTVQTEGELPALTAVALLNRTALAVGLTGTIIRSENFIQGEWQAIDHGLTSERLLAVELHASGLAVAVGGFGAILISKDFGKRWQAVQLDWLEFNEEGLEPHLYDIAILDSATIVIAGELGQVLRSEDGGNSWRSTRTGEESIFAMRFDNKGNGYAVGQDGLVISTNDGGNSWLNEPALGTSNLFDVWFDEGNTWVAGMRSLSHRKTGGQDWQPVNNEVVKTSWFQAIGHAQGHTYVVGQSGLILELSSQSQQ